jgi:hypothetical protein
MKEYFIGQIDPIENIDEIPIFLNEAINSYHPYNWIFYVSLHFIENLAVADIPLFDMAFTSYS